MPVDLGTVRAHLRGRRWYGGEPVQSVLDLGDLGPVRHVLGLVDGAAYQCFIDEDGQDAVDHPAVIARMTGETDPPEARSLAVEQSNTSLVLTDGRLAKVFRRLHPGPNPDVEVPASLGARDFAGVVAPVATWTQEGWDLGVVVPFLSGAADGWDVALATADPAALAFELGGVIADLHAALAEAFGAAPADPATYVHVYEAAVEGAQGVVDPVERGRLRFMQEPGAAIRVHGDLHLGQLLRHEGRWRVIDFEGEPTRSLVERKAHASPLKDAAGMVRSFAYAAAVAGHEEGWDHRAADAFLTAYLTSPAVAHLLPSEPGPVLDAYILEKAVYELAYERGHRPDWAWIPETAIARLVVSS